MLRWILLLCSHGATLGLGFALGVYFLPILIAPPHPDRSELAQAAQSARYRAEFSRDLAGSDFLHWGEGEVSLSDDVIAHSGRLAPGPDYKLYLVSDFVENEEQFLALKESSSLIGDVKTFGGFMLDVPPSVSIDAYTTVVVWCETFGEFITAARYR